MNYMYKEKHEQNQGVLSATRPKEPILNVRYKQENQLKTKLKQKKKIIIYKENGKYFVEHAAAYALGLTNVRAIMLEKPKLVEISSGIHNKLCANDEIEIEYVVLENKKDKLKVFVDGSSFYVENGAAYALGLMTVEDFNNADGNYYYISETLLPILNEKYDIEMHSIKLFEESNEKSR